MPTYAGPSAAPPGNPGSAELDPLDLGSTWLLPPAMLEHSPSRKDQVSDEEERKYRRSTVNFMERFNVQVEVPKADFMGAAEVREGEGQRTLMRRRKPRVMKESA